MKVYHNGPILTMDDALPLAEVLLEEAGRILYVGTLEAARPHITADAEWVDLAGHTLMPALIDAHSHISDTAMLLKSANLQEAKTFDDIVAILKAFVQGRDTSDQPFLVGLGYDHNALAEGIHPDKFLLDAAFPDRAVVIVHTSIHMCVANSQMLALMGIDKTTPCPEGGIIGTVPGTTEPNGYLEETAFNPLYERICEQLALTAEDIIATQYYYMANGILTIQEGSTDAPIVDVCRQAADTGRLVCDIVAYPAFNFGRGIGDSLTANAGCIRNYCNHFRVGGYKLILDGSPQGRSAWMSEPYEGTTDFTSYGWLSDEEVQAYTDQAYAEGQQLLAHCNGDAASEQFLVACEHAAAQYPDMDARPVMIHCQTVRDDQLDRMARIGMVASFFVDHVYYWGDAHLANFGPVRGPHISPVRAALDRGVAVSFHTDSPVVPPRLFQTLWTATNRITKSGVVLGADQCVDTWEALKALTIGAAYGYFEEDEKGSLTPGKLADLIIVSQNPLTTAKADLASLQCLACIKEGQEVWHA